jgi:hypothetical protein
MHSRRIKIDLEEKMFEDPIVKEVRDAGKKLSEDCENDIHKFADMIRLKEKELEKQGWKFVSKKDI